MKNIFKALAEFQQDIPIIHKDSKGYNYSYTGLATIIETIKPLLKKHGLGFYQPLHENSIITVVYHIESGESITSTSNIPIESLEYVEVLKKDNNNNEIKKLEIPGFEGMNKAQAYGSLITYFRRYALSSILGLVTDSDSDARNQRIAQKEVQAEQIDELKELAKLADVSVIDLMKAYKSHGYDSIKKRLTDKIKQNEAV